jgi:hypothetical protein
MNRSTTVAVATAAVALGCLVGCSSTTSPSGGAGTSSAPHSGTTVTPSHATTKLSLAATSPFPSVSGTGHSWTRKSTCATVKELNTATGQSFALADTKTPSKGCGYTFANGQNAMFLWPVGGMSDVTNYYTKEEVPPFGSGAAFNFIPGGSGEGATPLCELTIPLSSGEPELLSWQTDVVSADKICAAVAAAMPLFADQS